MKKDRIARRALLPVALIGTALAFLFCEYSEAKPSKEGTPGQRPNILFILTDQQTCKAMSAYGNKWLHTPNMDSIAAKGVRFEKSYCTAPVCSPSRSSLITGLMPHETGVDVNGQRIEAGIPHMGDIFRNAGYETAWVGKWHLIKSYSETKDETFGGFEYLPIPKVPRIGLGSNADGPTVDQAIKFLRRERDKPFLLCVSLHNPHDICHWLGVNADTKHTVTDQFPPLPANFAIDPNEPEFIKKCRQRKTYGTEIQNTKTWDENQWRAYLHAYYRLVEDVDKQIGRVLATLRELGLEDDTLIILTSDHGEGSAGHQWVVKLMLYEEPVTVPFVVSYKGRIPAGKADKTHLVSGMDVLPTMCDYAGIEGPRMTGMSLKPLIEKPELPGREYVVSELAPYPKKMNRKGRMVRSQGYKYIVFSTGQNPEMLFDMKNDPGETKNLAYDPAMKKVLAQHRNMLADWIKQTNDDFKLPV